jgi:hypothetical protein
MRFVVKELTRKHLLLNLLLALSEEEELETVGFVSLSICEATRAT